MALEIDYKKTLLEISHSIEALKKDYPNLNEFSTANHTKLDDLSISYSFHTHVAQHRGGWSSGVPNPDDDGIWFHLDFHDPNSRAKIHTQPLVKTMCIGNKISFLLILEGKYSKPVSSAIWAILESNGSKPCGTYQRDVHLPMMIDENTYESWGQQKEFFISKGFKKLVWEEAKKMLLNGNIVGGKQYHTGWLTLYAVNGDSYLTLQPRIDAVFEYAKQQNLQLKGFATE